MELSCLLALILKTPLDSVMLADASTAVSAHVLKPEDIPPAEPSMNFNAEGKPIVKPCCACPSTKSQRDECVLQFGQEDVRCADLIAEHKKCMSAFGFKV